MRSRTCEEHAEILANIVRKKIEEEKVDTIILSGGIDTTFVAISGKGILKRAISVFYDKEAPDYIYAKKVASRLSLKHYEAIGYKEEHLMEVLKIVRSIDPVEVLCDIPIYIAIKLAKELGERMVITGDGGDELFLGYSFLLNSKKEEIEKWLEKIEKKANFSSGIIGRRLGVKVIYGLYFPELIKYQRDIPLSCKISEREGRRYGKYLLRIYISRKFGEIAWRRKDPVMYGSGFNNVLRDWTSKISLREAKELCSEYGIRFPSYAHAYLLKKMIELGVKIPERNGECPVCGSALEDGFCRFCGTYVSEEGEISHYSDSLKEELKREPC